MPPSRRRFLRASAAAVAGLAGCLGDPDAAGSAPTSASRSTVPPDTAMATSGSRTATPEPAGALRCGPGPLPDAGWPLPDRSLGRTNHAPDAAGPTEAPTAAWTVTPPEPELGDNAFTRPVVADGRVYVGRQVLVGPEQQLPEEHAVHAYDAATGEEVWHATVPGRPDTPMVAGDVVLVDDDTTLYALDPASGAERWSYEPAGGVHHVLPTPDGVLTVPWRDDPAYEVVALDDEGRVDWRVGVPGNVDAAPAWVDGRAFLGTSEAVLVAIDTGEPAVAWTRDLQDGEDTVPVALVATPCAVFVTVDGELYAVDREGALAWSVAAGGRQLAADGEAVYTVDGDGHVRARAVDDGTSRWEGFHGVEDVRYTDGFYDEPAVDARSLYAGSLDRSLVAVALEDGRTRWRLDLGWEGPAQTVVVGDTLYAAGGAHLVAFR